jgi:hypothetical protein
MPRPTPCTCVVIAALASSSTFVLAEAPPRPSPGAEKASALSGAGPKDFADEARRLYRVVACAGDDPVPADLDASVVESHCKQMREKMARYEKKYIGGAKQFIGELRPGGLPTTVVYPFGGGDLLSVFTSYPDFTEVTTMSLEHAGDPRRIVKLSKGQLNQSLGQLRKAIWGLLVADNSTTANMQRMQRGEIPGQLAFFLVALALYGFEPVSLKYFDLAPDGSVHYLTDAEIAAVEKRRAATLRGKWDPPDSSVAFSNMEITFRARGDTSGKVRVHRHMAKNLIDDALAKDPSLMKHLEAKGKVSAITKAASYLLWREDFSTVRNYLLANMEWMISDSTGIPPRFLEGTRWTQETYGKFVGSFLPASEAHNKDFRALWKSQPARPLAFRYGYIDAGSNFHLLVTKQGK